MLHAWQTTLDQSGVVGAVLVDFKKAFDLVNYNLLLQNSLVVFHTFSLNGFCARRLSVERNSYSDVAGWAGGWLGGCPSQPVLYQND